jgi:hypothetical protein
MSPDILAGARFDVALVRAYCERLVAEGERLAAEREVFADWTRLRGLGPEDYGMSPAAIAAGFVSGKWSGRTLADIRHIVNGGWPGPLAREYGWGRCAFCDGGDSPVWDSTGREVKCGRCKGRGRTRKHGVPAGFVNGDSIARTARRLLDTLDGRCPWAPSVLAQASGCPLCAEGTLVTGPHPRPPTGAFASLNQIAAIEVEPGRWAWSSACPTCRGTGHNLAGVLPAPRVSQAILTPGAVRAARAATRARQVNEIAELAVRAIRGVVGG